MTTTGRPSKLTPELSTKIVQLITAGCYPEVAAGACGVSRTTFYEWMQRAAGEHPTRKPTKTMVAFADAICEAIDKSEVRLVLKLAEYEEGFKKGTRKQRIRSRLTMGQVVACQWKLSRRFPDRWGQRPAGAQVSVTTGDPSEDGDSGHGVRIEVVLAPENEGDASPA